MARSGKVNATFRLAFVITSLRFKKVCRGPIEDHDAQHCFGVKSLTRNPQRNTLCESQLKPKAETHMLPVFSKKKKTIVY